MKKLFKSFLKGERAENSEWSTRKNVLYYKLGAVKVPVAALFMGYDGTRQYGVRKSVALDDKFAEVMKCLEGKTVIELRDFSTVFDYYNSNNSETIFVRAFEIKKAGLIPPARIYEKSHENATRAWAVAHEKNRRNTGRKIKYLAFYDEMAADRFTPLWGHWVGLSSKTELMKYNLYASNPVVLPF